MRLSTCLVLLASLPFALSFDHEFAQARARALGLEPRQNSGSAAPSQPAAPSNTPAPPVSTPEDPPVQSSAPPAASSTPRNQASSTPPAADPNTSRPQAAPSTPTDQSTPPANDAPASQSPSRTQQQQTSRTPIASITTDDSGNVVTVTIMPSAESSSAPSASTTPREPKPISQSTIIGLSVAGGITVLGIIAFIVWKVTNKRFSNFDDDDGEPIKWPELNNANNQDSNNRGMGGLGGASLDSRSEVFMNTAANSTSELSHDPYRVPPLPPAQAPYTDDPAGYYDPYRGPVPQTFASPPQSHDGHHYAGEAIPMSTYGRSRSPGPNAAYDPYARSGSPGPGLAYDAGRRSPGPGLAYDSSGRGSPAPPNMGMYDQGRSSPAPYDQGRRSPGPGLAYGGRTSPGPNLAYDQGYR